jgi:hypothetical protein
MAKKIGLTVDDWHLDVHYNCLEDFLTEEFSLKKPTWDIEDKRQQKTRYNAAFFSLNFNKLFKSISDKCYYRK